MKWTKLQFLLRPKDELFLPKYKGSTLRGVLGRGLKETLCTEECSDCHHCPLRTRCLYIYIFETPCLNGFKGFPFSGNKELPRPFVVQPPLEENAHYTLSDCLSFNILLFGCAIDYFPYFIFSFEKMGETGIGKSRGRYTLEKVFSMRDSDSLMIYSANEGVISSDILISNFTELEEKAKLWNGVDRIKVRFLTPANIKHAGKPTFELPFYFLLQALLIRVKALALHSNEGTEFNFHDLMAEAKEGVTTIESNLQWKGWRRYSMRKGRHLNQGGLCGEVIYQGQLLKFMPFLLLGQEIHVGKETSFGLGRMEVIAS